MKIVSPYALALALLIPLAPQACATPLELTGCEPGSSQDCDVIFANPNEFAPDASVGAGGQSGAGGGNPQQGGAGGVNPSQGGSPSLGGSGNPGTGGTAQGGSAPGTGGTAITAGAAGNAGSAGAAGTGMGGTGGAGGTGGVDPVFDSASCDFVDTSGCEAFGCQNCGPTDTYCAQQCPLVIDCASDNIACLSATDPLCGRRDGAEEQACTDLVEASGGLNPAPGQPTSFARPFVECVCSTPRPGQ